MSKMHIKKGDEVVVCSGPERPYLDPESGDLIVKRGRVLHLHSSKQRALVEGCRIIKKHTRRSQLNPQGKIVEQEGTIHVSNLMKVANFEARMSKRGMKLKQS